MGFVGKNTMLIVPGRGSFLFLGEVLWDVHVEGAAPDSDEQALVSRACGTCTRCLDRCPTSAFLSERVLDAKRCIAYLTIEKRGVLTREERRMIGPWVFGCDVCQEVCPYNYTAIKTRKGADVAALSRESGVGPLLDLTDVLSIRTHEAFAARYAGTAIMRARREGLVRNAVCVATNTSQSTLLPNVVNVAGGDPSPVVRAHALWAAWALAGQVGEGRAAVQALRDKCFGDPDEGVRREAGALDGE
jgi:epoxyqueuosine reductase